jgi:RNA polymerase-binding transcription factor DksA
MNINTQRTILKARRAELAGDLLQIEDQLDDTPTKDWEDRASERQGDEVLEALGHVELAELKRIDAALDRINDGTYGTCLSCGDPISDARLELLPDAALCRTCAHAAQASAARRR